jgi:thiamine biosynthesis lipoprotein
MACRFEIALWGEDESQLRPIAQEAWDLVDRLEGQLSVFRPDSDVSWINTQAALAPVRVEPHLFDLLLLCQRVSQETGGAFDITTGPLSRCWGFHNRQGRVPDEEELIRALASVGMRHVRLDPVERTVAFSHSGVEINLGGVGKGYALRRIREMARSFGVTSMLAHSGRSTISAGGAPPGTEHWPVGITDPAKGTRRLATVGLLHGSLATSGNTDQYFEQEGRVLGHILDPRTGFPVEGVRAVWVACPDPAEADALSTGLYVMGPVAAWSLLKARPDVGAYFALEPGNTPSEVDLGLMAPLAAPE